MFHHPNPTNTVNFVITISMKCQINSNPNYLYIRPLKPENMIRILTLGVIGALLLNSCTTENQYQINGDISGFDDDYILLVNNNQTDTVPVTDHSFSYEGLVDTAHLVHLKVPSYSRNQEFFLEPGTIDISYLSKKSFIASGTETNESFFDYKRGMDSATTLVLEAYQVYMKAETKEAQDEKLRLYDNIEEERRAFMRIHLRKNPNLTGIQILKSIHRTDSVENLGPYLDLLKDFAYTEIYKEVDTYFASRISTLTGKLAPQFTLPDSLGNMIELESLRGKYVLLDFWFTGCTYCDMLVPHLKNIYTDLNIEGFEIIDISVDKEVSKWLSTVRKKDSPWTHLQDADKKVATSFGMSGYPTLILINREGKVADRLVGYRDEDVLRKEIRSVMSN